MEKLYDVAVVGGSFAGLGGAVALARSRRSVAVIDAGAPRNAPAAGAHNVLGREGVSPLELLAEGRREALGYGAELIEGEAVTAQRDGEGFVLGLRDGTAVHARRLLLATGLVDELPDLPGLRELWGKSVLHCPYCHGWEVRDQRVGILGTDERALHQALLFRQLSESVTLLRHTMPELDGEAAEQLAALGVDVVEGTVARLAADGGALRAAVLDDGRELALDALVVAPAFGARTALYEQLGGTPSPHPMGTFIETDPMGRTGVPGVWAAGNARDLAAMVSASSAAGVMAGAAINADLVMDGAARAVASRRATPPPAVVR